MDRDTIVREIQRVAKERGISQLSRSEFSARTSISTWHIYQLFDGWRNACKAAGVQPNEQNLPLDKDTLFQEMRKVFIGQGGICTRTKFGRLSKFSDAPYKKRFGGRWPNILKRFHEWLLENKIEFPFMQELISESQKSEANEKAISLQQLKGPQSQWKSIGGPTYGSFLNFRGLQHAPVNEQGVVFLFGMVCFELGYVVEAVRTDYPDCDAKRCVDKSKDKWERVRIEFEYRSSTFKDHGHNPAECDVIVCWEHDWSGCPLEVVELRSAIQTLDK